MQFYRRAAVLTHAYRAANGRMRDLDVIVSRRVRMGRPVEEPGRSRRACGARAARVTMDRECAAMSGRLEARNKAWFDAEEDKARTPLEALAETGSNGQPN